jgi:hypothetical protein
MERGAGDKSLVMLSTLAQGMLILFPRSATLSFVWHPGRSFVASRKPEPGGRSNQGHSTAGQSSVFKLPAHDEHVREERSESHS